MLEKIRGIDKRYAVISLIIAMWLHFYVKSLEEESHDGVYLEKQHGWRNQHVQKNRCKSAKEPDYGSAGRGRTD